MASTSSFGGGTWSWRTRRWLELEETVLVIQADLDAIALRPATSNEVGAADGDSGPESIIIVGAPSTARLR
jgi:hypothetical protein